MTGGTQVRVAPTRLPERVRPRLARLARRGAEVCTQHGAGLLGEICYTLEIALLDLASAELRASNAELRARRAERDLAAAQSELRALQAAIARAAEFAEQPTLAREAPAPLVARCRTEVGNAR